MQKSNSITDLQPAAASRWGRIAILAAAIMLTAGAASAEFVAYTGLPNPQTQPPLQAYGGSLGMNFTVNGEIQVDSMGIYNASGTGAVTGTLQVAIYEQNPDSSWSLMPGTLTTFTSSNPGTQDLVNDGAYDVYQAIAPVVLNPGDYAIVAVGFSTSYPDGNSGYPSGVGAAEDQSGSLTYTGTGEYDVSQPGQMVFPDTVDGGPANRYDAGTFEFSQVPEPASFFLIGTGLLLSILVARRRTAAPAFLSSDFYNNQESKEIIRPTGEAI